jgi:hypothetical protein
MTERSPLEVDKVAMNQSSAAVDGQPKDNRHVSGPCKVLFPDCRAYHRIPHPAHDLYAHTMRGASHCDADLDQDGIKV